MVLKDFWEPFPDKAETSAVDLVPPSFPSSAWERAKTRSSCFSPLEL
jgi:hypothetical protein